MKDTCTVSNKSAGVLVYKIPELSLRREFAPGETKKDIAVRELEQLIQLSGGRTLIEEYMLIHDAEIVQHLLNVEVPLEYWLNPKDIPSWMDTCGIDEFEDALRFAPAGTKDLIKSYAVSMPLNDYSKRELIKQYLNFDISKAVENNAESAAATPTAASAAATPTAASAQQRKATSSSIKVPTDSSEEKRITIDKED